MKRYNKAFVWVALIAAAFFLASCDDPPIREEVEFNEQNYFKVNRYVSGLREKFIKDNRITAGFFPSQFDKDQTVEYLYWYSCAIFGDPNYAISVTVQFPTDEALLCERNRIKELDGFTENFYNDSIIIGGKDLSIKLAGFFEPPVLDGSRYTMEYAIASPKNRTITYSELSIWENQIIHDKIRSQLNLVYESTQSAD